MIDEENNQLGIVPTREGINRAREAGLDLVEVAPTSDPPVCRIMDYGKWQYQQKRKLRESHKKTPKNVTSLKEIRLRPETDTHDLQIKQKKARRHLKNFPLKQLPSDNPEAQLLTSALCLAQF